MGGVGEAIPSCKKEGKEGDSTAVHNRTQGKPRHLSEAQRVLESGAGTHRQMTGEIHQREKVGARGKLGEMCLSNPP